MSLFAESTVQPLFATVILPLAVPKLYTYLVLEEHQAFIQQGVRVEVQFGKSRLYAALVYEFGREKPAAYDPKPLLSVLDKTPIVTVHQLKLWSWIAKYYACTMGEVMNAALPAGLKLNSETKLRLAEGFDDDFSELEDKEYLIAEALTLQADLRIIDVQKILGQKTVYPIIQSLLQKRVILIEEELQQKYKPRTATFLRFKEPYASEPKQMQTAFELVARAEQQTKALLACIQLLKHKKRILRKTVCDTAQVTTAVIKAIEKKDILESFTRTISRLKDYEEETNPFFESSVQQKQALIAVQTHFQHKNVVLLHGVTGSGKTQVYIELIQEAIQKGGQVLYLLPEIALTTQIVVRLQKVFGNSIAIYHSRLNDGERVEVWKQILEGKAVVLCARSGLFLPFKNLDLIIVDEEHDPSFKQTNPSPRYNARDTAVYLAHLHQAKVLLGSATPSIESYQNAQQGKYGLVELLERFGGIEMPEIVIANAGEERRKRKMQAHFTTLLLEELQQALAKGEQAILFQNRRGYAPTLRCETCAWTSDCMNCDVSLTYHKYADNMRCHYCGYQTEQPKECPACGDTKLTIKGFGTEKIEDELAIYLPDAKIARMDWDTVRSKHAHAKIIEQFEQKQIDVLVGTQMVTKGLDFDNVSIVGVISADNLLHFPDFRATERAFQLMTQVSGRAGRKRKQGKVIIQAFQVTHPVLKEVINNDYKGFFERELMERKDFLYPPFFRLIKITLKHKKVQMVQRAAELMTIALKKQLKKRVIGPAEPHIGRVRTYYLRNIIIKLERDAPFIKEAKAHILQVQKEIKQKEGLSSLRVNIDVDNY